MDLTKAGAFADRLTRTLNEAHAALLMALGHQAGLFEAMAGLGPARAEALAARAGVDQRTLQEWLGAMACAGVVTYDPLHQNYHLPLEHAASLTPLAGERNLAARALELPLVADLLPALLMAMQGGPGLTAQQLAPLDALRREQEEAGAADRVFAALSDRPALWQQLHAGISVLEVGCGRGRTLRALARAFRASKFLGVDPSETAVAEARSVTATWVNLAYQAFDPVALPGEDKHELALALGAVERAARPMELLRTVHRLLQPGGLLLMSLGRAHSDLPSNLQHPEGVRRYALSLAHTLPAATEQKGEAFGLMWGKEAAEATLHLVGFNAIEARESELDPDRTWIWARKG